MTLLLEAATCMVFIVGLLALEASCMWSVKQELCWPILPGALSGLTGRMYGLRSSGGSSQKDRPTALSTYLFRIVITVW